MERLGRSIQGSQSLSRYGDHIAVILPSVLPATPARRREGFTDLSRMDECDRSHSGQLFHLPDKEFRSDAPQGFPGGRTLS